MGSRSLWLGAQLPEYGGSATRHRVCVLVRVLECANLWCAALYKVAWDLLVVGELISAAPILDHNGAAPAFPGDVACSRTGEIFTINVLGQIRHGVGAGEGRGLYQ